MEISKKKLNEKSNFLSLILQHDPASIGIKMDSQGWVSVSNLCKLMPIDFDILEFIVNVDDKQRYSFNDKKTLIRANQGHSLDID
jgi:putative RNA 2'-phosphotransferase